MGHGFNNWLGAITGVGPRLGQMEKYRLENAALRGNLWQDPGARAAMFTDPGMQNYGLGDFSTVPRGTAGPGAYPQLGTDDPRILPYITQVPGGLPPQVETAESAGIGLKQAQAQQLLAESGWLQTLQEQFGNLGGAGGGAFGRRRSTRIDPATGKIVFEFTDEPYKRGAGQTPTPPKLNLQPGPKERAAPTGRIGGLNTGSTTPPPGEAGSAALPDPRTLQTARRARANKGFDYQMDDGTKITGTFGPDGMLATLSDGSKVMYDERNGGFIPIPGQQLGGDGTANAAPPPTTPATTSTTTSPTSTSTTTTRVLGDRRPTLQQPSNPLAEPAPTGAPAATGAPTVTPTTQPGAATTTSTIGPGTRVGDLMNRPPAGAAAPSGVPTVTPTTQPPTATTAPAVTPSTVPPSTAPAEDFEADAAERRLGMPPTTTTQPQVGFPSPAPTEGMAAGQAVGAALAPPSVGGAGPTVLQPATPMGRILGPVKSAIRTLGPASAQAADQAQGRIPGIDELGSGAPAPDANVVETTPQVAADDKWYQSFADAYDNYPALRSHIQKHYRPDTDVQTLYMDTAIQGMVKRWGILSGVIEKRVGKMGELGAADTRVRNAIKAVLDTFQLFDTPDQRFGGKAPIDYLGDQTTRMGWGNIVETLPGIGATAAEIVKPGRTGIPGEMGQRVMPGAKMTAKEDSPRGRGTQYLLSLNKGFLSMLARGSAEVGNLNTLEQVNLQEAYMPNPDIDTPASARTKLELGRRVFGIFQQALDSGTLTGDQVMEMLMQGANIDFNELRRRSVQQSRPNIAVPGPIGGVPQPAPGP